MEFKICVVGLGLMGASLAQGLRGFKGARVVGVEQQPAARQKALEAGMVSAVFPDIAEGAAGADLIIFCVYARHLPPLLRAALPALKPGCLLADICGVKGPLYREILPLVPEGMRYVGIHPMAGRERDGIENADPALYQNTSLLICPTPKSAPEDIRLMEALARHLGCARTRTVQPEAHDALIAYTSDLMHVSAAGLCLRYPPKLDLAFTAGAFRDCTRVADINAEAWAGLLMENRQNTLGALEGYIADLQRLAGALRAGDDETLRRLLLQAGNNKREMLKR